MSLDAFYKIRYPLRDDGSRRVNEGQRAFHRAVNVHPFVLYAGGVGSGKTTAGGYESVRLCIQNGPGKSVDDPQAGMIVGHTHDIVENVMIPAFKSFLPPDMRKGFKYIASRKKIYLPGNRIIYVASASKPESLEGKNISWAWGDELRYWPKASWEKFIARFRSLRGKKPRVICTSTPAFNWMYLEFCKGKKGRKVIHASTSENLQNLRPGFISDLKASLSKRVYKSYVDGLFEEMVGDVFDEFDRNLHLVPYNDLYFPSAPVHIGFDPGRRKAAMVFFQHLELCPFHRMDDCIHVLGEYMNERRTTTPKMIRAAQKQFKLNAWKEGLIYIDKAGKAESSSTGQSDITALVHLGFEVRYTTAVEDCWVPYGIELINSKLKSVDGETSLYFNAELSDPNRERGVIASIQGSQYPSHKEGSSLSDSPKKEGIFEHARDALRYPLINIFPAEFSDLYAVG